MHTTQEFFPSLNLNKIRTRFLFGAVENPKKKIQNGTAKIRLDLVQMKQDFKPDGIL
jgi:hypothetical protein